MDLNCDMGEGCSTDPELMSLVTSANIACGYHAGDDDTMKRTVDLAMEHGTGIGAHPGYADRANFGRTDMDLSAGEIHGLLTDQLDALQRVCRTSGTKLRHVKPHGSLYNQSARDPELATVIAQAVWDFDRHLVLLGLSGSHSIRAAREIGLKTAAEAFADRTYRADGSLTPRTMPNALIREPEAAAKQALAISLGKAITTVDGPNIKVHAETICVHGDGPRPVEFATAIRRALEAYDVSVRPF
jgi:5-oxoprolinase (ATP-hydrolysing) subunit A